MDYTSTLEVLENFWMALSRCSKHPVGAWAILYHLVKVRFLGIAHGSQQGALFTLTELLSITYRWITQVL